MFKNDPPANPVLPLQLVRARPNQPLDCIVCNRSYVGLDTHYIGGATRACLGLPDCPGCGLGMVQRWQGYVIVQSMRVKNWALLQFTPIVGVQLNRSISRDTGLHGVCIRLTRLGPRINSPLDCQITGYQEDVQEWTSYRLEQIVRALFPDSWPEKLIETSG